MKNAPRVYPAAGRDGVQTATIRKAVKIISRKASSVTARAMAWCDMVISQANEAPPKGKCE
jgi:hypothetical protein